MRMARLELARIAPHAPQACVSTNSTTSARFDLNEYSILIWRSPRVFEKKIIQSLKMVLVFAESLQPISVWLISGLTLVWVLGLGA